MTFSEEPRPDLLDLTLEFNRRPSHWTSHRDGTHTQSTDTVNTIMDAACARIDEEEAVA